MRYPGSRDGRDGINVSDNRPYSPRDAKKGGFRWPVANITGWLEIIETVEIPC